MGLHNDKLSSSITHQEAVNAFQNFGMVKATLTKAIAAIAGIFIGHDSAFDWAVKHLSDMPVKTRETAKKADNFRPFTEIPARDSQPKALEIPKDLVHDISTEEANEALKNSRDGKYLIRGYKGASNHFMLGVKKEGKINYIHFTVNNGMIRSTNNQKEYTILDELLLENNAKSPIRKTVSQHGFDIKSIAHRYDSSTRRLLDNQPIGSYAVRGTEIKNKYAISVVKEDTSIKSMFFTLSESGKVIDEDKNEYSDFKEFLTSLKAINLIKP